LRTLLVTAIDRAKHLRSPATLLCVAAAPWFSTIACAGSARDYLNAPIDSWLTTYNASYSASVTPEDGTDVSSRARSNVFGQSVVISRTMDFWGRTGGLSVVLPYVFANANSSSFQARTTGVSDICSNHSFRRLSRVSISTLELLLAHTMPPHQLIRAQTVGRSLQPSITVTHRTKDGHGWKHISRPNFSRTITIFGQAERKCFLKTRSFAWRST
jgi:hypothetical protein